MANNRQPRNHMRRAIGIFRCPACGGKLDIKNSEIACQRSVHRFPVTDGIPQMFVPKDWDNGKLDVTDVVRRFYEKTPFPDYDEFDSVAALVEKSRKGCFARLLDDQIPVRTTILEVGCGTGQLTNFLGIAQRNVFGTDMCLNSLRLAEKFRRKNHLPRVGFYQMNLFRPIFKPKTFDLVICNGVLHHTGDPFGGFESIARLVKPGGYILVGLYNKYGRLMTDIRRLIFHLIGRRIYSLDPYLRERAKIDRKTESWFADQYEHPHESKHTMGEVLKWFDTVDFRFINSIPNIRAFSDEEKLFSGHARPDPITRAALQAHMIRTGNREGGLFIMIGRRLSQNDPISETRNNTDSPGELETDLSLRAS